MSKQIGRRALLAGAAAASVVAFSPRDRSWITIAHAKGGGSPIPKLDGELSVDPAALAEAADDHGHIISRTPIAVLRPGSIKDIRKMVKYANQHGIKVAMRGQGHSTHGQAQVNGGIVIDSRTLSTIHSIHAGGSCGARAEVDAGVTWSELVAQTVAQGLTPPVLTDYLDLSIGGTLSVGGIGGVAHRAGVQIDNVSELEVVTGEGKHVLCSAHKRSDLFHAVLGGLGQYGIIVRATVDLEPAEQSARVYQLFYTDINQFIADQVTCANDERFSYLEGQVQPNGMGGFQYMIEGAVWYSAPNTPNDAALTAGLSFASSAIQDQGYEQWLRRIEPVVEFLKLIGVWGFPHPWFDLFLPASQAANIATTALASVPPDSQDPILFYAFKASRLSRPLFRVPNEEFIFLFDILRTAPRGRRRRRTAESLVPASAPDHCAARRALQILRRGTPSP
ncbi:MAG: FAD-binding protein [Polyangiaceae bacterium]